MTTPRIVQLEQVASTQAELQALLDDTPAGEVVAVLARSQRAGLGREGRTWQDPPGAAVLLSVGARELPVAVLDDLPRRVAEAVLDLLALPTLAWKAPNDLVGAADGAKVGGVLVDARTLGPVARVAVGIGINVDGPAFTTADGRAATTLAALGGPGDAVEVGTRIAAAVAQLLSAPR